VVISGHLDGPLSAAREETYKLCRLEGEIARMGRARAIRNPRHFLRLGECSAADTAPATTTSAFPERTADALRFKGLCTIDCSNRSEEGALKSSAGILPAVSGASRPRAKAAKRRKNKAHGASRG
jgi:hypothetical protein